MSRTIEEWTSSEVQTITIEVDRALSQSNTAESQLAVATIGVMRMLGAIALVLGHIASEMKKR